MSSLLVKSVKWFGGLGAVSTIPLTFSFVQKNMSLGGATISQQETLQVETKEPANPMKQAMDMIGDGQSGKNAKSTKGCFWLSDQGRTRLFICVNDLESSNGSLFLFSYDWRAKENSTKKVIKIVKKDGSSNSRPSLMQFEKGGNENLPREASSLLAALWKEWEGSEFSTSHCKLTKDSGNSLKYSLTCPNPNKQPQTSQSWTKSVSKNDMTLSDNSSTQK